MSNKELVQEALKGLKSEAVGPLRKGDSIWVKFKGRGFTPSLLEDDGFERAGLLNGVLMDAYRMVATRDFSRQEVEKIVDRGRKSFEPISFEVPKNL